MVLIVWILYFSFTCVDRWVPNTWPWAGFHNQGLTLSFISLIIADQILNDLLCCSYKYNLCLCRSIGQLYILLITFLINFSDICKVLHETFWIKLKTDWGGQIVSCYGLIQNWHVYIYLLSTCILRSVSRRPLWVIDHFLLQLF